MDSHKVAKLKSIRRVLEVIYLKDKGHTLKEACEILGFRCDTTSRALRKYLRSQMTQSKRDQDIDKWKKKSKG